MLAVESRVPSGPATVASDAPAQVLAIAPGYIRGNTRIKAVVDRSDHVDRPDDLVRFHAPGYALMLPRKQGLIAFSFQIESS